MKQPGKIVVWTASIDRSKTRRQGRHTPKSLAVDSPRLVELEAAARALSLRFTSKQTASRPRSSKEKTGYILVEKGGLSRTEILKTMAKQVAKERPGKKT